MESRRYREYIRDPNVPMPKLSGTRPKQNCTPDIVTSNTANQPGLSCSYNYLDLWYRAKLVAANSNQVPFF